MKKIIDKFYNSLFADPANKEDVPHANKVAIFWISFVLGGTVLVMIALDVIKNIKK